MFLVLGNPDDTFASTVAAQLKNKGLKVLFYGEDQLFTTASFAFRHDQTKLDGLLQIGDDQIYLSQISGVVIRLLRTWWPSSDYDLQDQMFVYHEHTAAILDMLSSLRCPMINRFGLGWWLHDTTYPLKLGLEVAEALQIKTGEVIPTIDFQGRLIPSVPDPSPHTASIYMVGKHAIAQLPEHDIVNGVLSERIVSLSKWQERSGIRLCRLDFAINQEVTLQGVEVFPLFGTDDGRLISSITNAALDVLL